MTRIEMTRAFVEKVVREWLEVSVLTVDSDGDIPIRHGSAAYYIRVVESDPPVVSIFSTVLDGVPSSAKLLRHLNDLNARIAQAKVFHANNRVLMALHLLAETVTAEELDPGLHGRGRPVRPVRRRAQGPVRGRDRLPGRRHRRRRGRGLTWRSRRPC